MTVPEGWPEPGPFFGLEAARQQFERLLDSFATFDLSNAEIVAAAGDWVVASFHIPVAGAASGASSAIDVANAYRVEDGLLIECLIQWRVDLALEAAGLSRE